MYIVAIAWLYVTLLMAVTERNVVAGVMTFLAYGFLPLALLLWLLGGPRRRRRRDAGDDGASGDIDASGLHREPASSAGHGAEADRAVSPARRRSR
jgi:hypothetical protein